MPVTHEETVRAEDVTATLRAAKELIDKPRRWTQQAMARSATGALVNPNDPRAVRWCAEGAIAHVAPSVPLRLATLAALKDACDYGHSIVSVNDRKCFPLGGLLGYLAIHEALRRAIRTAERAHA